MRSQRQLRVGEAIRHALANVLLRGDVPWPRDFKAPLVTITEVSVSPDLQNAIAFVIPMGGEKIGETVSALNTIAGFFRHEIAEAVKLRYVPRLVFKTDDSFSKAQNIEKILKDPAVAKDLAGIEKE